MQGIVARETICEWNAAHFCTEKKVLVPLPMEQTGGGDPGGASDLLVAFLCASLGTPSDLSAQNVDLEVERQLKAGKPALIYFSEARTDFAGIDAREVKLLEEFKSRYPQEVRVDSFRDEKEFRAKFALQLETTIRQHRHFQEGTDEAKPATAVIPETHPPAPAYSKSAQSLLMCACDDPEAYIGHLKDARGLKLQVNGRQIVEQGNPESAAMWEAAFNELLSNGLIRDAGCNGKLFQISAKGFEFLETLGKFPVGYIAELGGM
jgi:hypothetical protein